MFKINILKRDLVWIILILLLTIEVIFSVKLSDNQDIVNIFSFVSSGVSIALAFVAIGYAIFQTNQAEKQSSATLNTLGEIKNEINRVNQIKDDLTKTQNEINRDFKENIEKIEELLKSTERITSDIVEEETEDKDAKIVEYKNVFSNLSTQLDKLKENQIKTFYKTYNNYHSADKIDIDKNQVQSLMKKYCLIVEAKIINQQKADNFLPLLSHKIETYGVDLKFVEKSIKDTKNKNIYIFTFHYLSSNGKIPRNFIKEIFNYIDVENVQLIAIRNH